MRVARATLLGMLLGAVSIDAVAQQQEPGEAPRERSLSAANDPLRIVVSLSARTLWVLSGPDTVRTAPIAVASGEVLRYAGRQWRFATPRGRHVVLGKRVAPVWAPPDWHYAETARDHALRLRRLPADGVVLADGRRLVIRDSLVGIMAGSGAGFAPLPVDEHVVFDSTLFIPPVGTRNRQLEGALGAFALDLGDGYLLHGTPDPTSIGTASTHGCIRLGDADIAWLHDHVPVGAPVHVR
jgi:lipoprotein-anchoring transpeptidase ErfK/SrfK